MNEGTSLARLQPTCLLQPAGNWNDQNNNYNYKNQYHIFLPGNPIDVKSLPECKMQMLIIKATRWL